MEKSEFTDHAGMCHDADIIASLDKGRGGKFKNLLVERVRVSSLSLILETPFSHLLSPLFHNIISDNLSLINIYILSPDADASHH